MTGNSAVQEPPTVTSVGTSRLNIVRVLRSGAALAALSVPINILVLPFVLHRVSIQRYGEWATLSAIYAIVLLADAGISTDIARRVADAYGRADEEGIRRAVQRGITVLTVLATCMVAVAALAANPVVSLLFPNVHGGERHTIILVYLGMLALLGMSLVLSGYLAALGGFQRSDFNAWGSLAGLIGGTLATLVGATLHAGLWALFAGACARSLIGWTVPLMGLRRLRPDVRFRFQRVGFRESWSFVGMPALLLVASLGNLFQYQVDKFVLAHFKGARDAGLYQLGLNLVTQAEALALIPLGVLLAATAELHLTNPGKLYRLERVASAACLSAAAVVLGGLVVFSASFYVIWLGPEYDVSGYATRALAAAALIGFIAAPWYYYMLGRALYRYIVVGAIANLSVNLICTVALTPRFGITGALIGTAAGNVAALLVTWLLLRRIERRPWIRPAFRPYLTVGVVAVPAAALQELWQPDSWPALVAAVVAFVLIAGVALIVVRAVPLSIALKGGRPTLSLSEEARSLPTSGVE